MDIELILQKFAVFSGLTGEELQACLPYCRDAMEQLTAKRRSASRPGQCRGSVAYRWCGADERRSLRPMGGGGPGEQGHAGGGQALCEEYWWRPPGAGGKFYFGQVTACSNQSI
ncbi:MAG: hypothetical protein ACLUNX_03170 [Angelakisella sp.]